MKKIEKIMYKICLIGICAIVLSFVTSFVMYITTSVAYGQSTKTLVIGQKPKKGDKTATEYKVVVNNTTYVVYRGPRGGYFYEVNGKRVYLTKAQKAKLGL